MSYTGCCDLKLQVTPDAMPALAAATLHIALQQGGTVAGDPPPLPPAAVGEAFGVSGQAVADMSWQLRKVLQDDTLSISAMRCLKVYLERMGCR